MKKKKGNRQKVVGVGTKNFIPWVPPISSRFPDREKEEEGEDDMSELVHNFTAQKWKRDASLKQAADATLEVAGGSSQPCPNGGSKVQAIIILGSPKMGVNDQSGRGNVTLAESREAYLVPAALQVVRPPKQATD